MGDEYVKEKRLGRGSFGIAFLVRHRPSNQLAVLKEVYLKGLSSAQRDSARRELNLLQQLNHTHIVSYLESWETPLKLFLVMDYCPQGDLTRYLEQRRGVALPETLICNWLTQLALALNYLHRRKILHRDVKCENIFLDDCLRAKLGDFGIARMLDHTSQLANTCIGTPTYLSPELCRHAPYNHKSDLWALGCVLYQITALKQPFPGKSLQQLMTNILRGRYVPLPTRYSYELRQLAAKLLKTLPDDRPDAAQILSSPFLSNCLIQWANDEEKRDFLLKNVQKPRAKVSTGLRLKTLPTRRVALGHLSVYVSGSKKTRTTRKFPRKPLEPSEADWESTPCTEIGENSLEPPKPKRKQWHQPSKTLLSALSSHDIEESVENTSEDDKILQSLEEPEDETALTLERLRCHWEAVLGVAFLKQLCSEGWTQASEPVFSVKLLVQQQLPNELEPFSEAITEFIEDDIRYYTN